MLSAILRAFSGGSTVLGAILVGWNSVEVYYLVTGRVTADPDQPPLTVVIPLLIVGLVLMIGGYVAGRVLRRKKDRWDLD